jgi:hypothetical protein
MTTVGYAQGLLPLFQADGALPEFPITVLVRHTPFHTPYVILYDDARAIAFDGPRLDTKSGMALTKTITFEASRVCEKGEDGRWVITSGSRENDERTIAGALAGVDAGITYHVEH